MQPSDAVAIALSIGFVAGFFFLMFYALSRISGWSGMSGSFPPVAASQDSSWSFGSMAMGVRWMRYNNCVRIGVDDDHLHIRMLRVFSAFHKPISIPWEAVRFPERLPKGGLFETWVRLEVEGGRTVWLAPRAVRREIEVRRAMAGVE